MKPREIPSLSGLEKTGKTLTIQNWVIFFCCLRLQKLLAHSATIEFKDIITYEAVRSTSSPTNI